MMFGLDLGVTGDVGIKGFSIRPWGWMCKILLPEGGLVRGWNEPYKTLPYSDFRQCFAQERLVSQDSRQGQGHTGFTANSLNTPHLQRETPDLSVPVCREGRAEQCTTTMAFAAAWCSGDSNRDMATHRE